MKRHRSRRPDRLIFEELEPRILLSADLAGVALDLSPNDVESTDDESDLQTIVAALQSNPTGDAGETDGSSLELVIVDPAIPDYQSMVDDLIRRNGEGYSYAIVVLDMESSGIDQLNETLSNYRNLDAMHLITHGGDGAIQIGKDTIDHETLNQKADELRTWSDAFTSDADILIYGCNVAATAEGEQLLSTLAQLTGTDIAASDDLTGDVQKNGDWDLEFTSGSIESGLALSAGLQQNFHHTLDITTGLQGHWAFDANAADSSGNNYHGTLTNGAAIDTNVATNIVGGGKLSVDGINDYADLSSHIAGFSGLGQGTVAAWVNTTSSAAQYIFSIYDRSLSSDANIGMINGEFYYYAQNWGEGILLNVQANTPINDGAWHHVAVTVDGSGNSLYVDGVQMTGAAITYLNGTSATSAFFNDVDFIDDMQIGSIDDTMTGIVNPTNGFIDEVRVYDRALTAADMAELANLAPTIDSASMTLSEGEIVTLTAADFTVTDPDDTAFTYTVSSVTDGYFQLSSNPGTSISTFTSANLTAGVVQFVDDGDEVAPSFSVTVNDGFIDSNTLVATVNYTAMNDAPVNTLPASVSTNEDTTVNFSGVNQIQISDADHAGGTLQVALNVDTGGLLTFGDTTGLIFSTGDGTDDANMVFTGTLAEINAALLTLSFTPTTDFNGNVNLTVTTNDRGNSGSDPGLTGDAGSEQDNDSITLTVNPVNDDPIATADSISVAEGGTATTLVGGSTTVLNNDTGLGDTPVTVTLITDVTNGTLTLNGDGTFSYTHNGSENFTDSFTYRVTDNDGQTSDATVTINITPVSDTTPTATADSISLAEGGTATTLVGGSTTVLNNDAGLSDTPVTVSLVTDVTNGTLTLNGDGTFSYTHNGSEIFTDSFTYRVTDNDGQTSDATVTINITPVSDTTPVANVDSITVAEGGTATTLVGGSSTVLNNDTGLNDTPVTVSLVTDVSNGTLTLNGDGTFSYTHNGSEIFIDSFTYRVTDNDGQTSDATVTINITPVSDTTPVANIDSISVAEGGTATTLVGGFTTVLNNDTGLGDTPVTVSLITDVTNGTLTLNGDGTFSYTHNGSENFTDSFTYRVTDNDGQTSDATVTINITPVSDTTPTTTADSISLAEGGTATTLVGGSTTVLNNDAGLSDTPVTVSLVTDVTNGTLTLNGDGTFSYTHNGSENFTDSFTYRVTDNDGQTSDATVTINITPVSDTTPTATADSISLAEGGTATTLVGGSTTVLNNDAGLSDTPVTVSLVTDVTNGTLTLNGDGTFSYTHNGSENFTDSFTYRVTDNDGQTSDATVTINITPVSDTTPTATADSISLAEGGTATTLVGGSTTVLNNDAGLSDTPVTVSLVTDVSNGTLTLNGDGTFSYTHNGSEIFTDSFTYRVTDNDGQASDATVTINITPVSDTTPVANVDSITVAEGGTATTLVGGSSTVLNNDTGLNDTPVTVSLVTDVSNGTLTLNGDGTFSYTHNGSEIFTDSFTYRMTDNDGQTSDATVTINITPVSDTTPVANIDSITVAEGGTATTLVGGSSTVLNNDTGLNDTPVTVSLVTDVTNGTLTLNGDGTFSYTHNGSENFTDSFTYRVTDNDGQTSDATVTINITPVSDTTPTATADSISLAEGGTATTLVGGSTTVLNNDAGLSDTPVTVSLVTDVSNGTLTLNGDGTFSYTHNGSEIFTDSFTYRVTDNDGQASDATVTINITPVSDTTPVANIDSISVAEGGTATTLVGGSSTVLNNDTGLNDTPVTVSLVTDVSNGTLTLNGDGTFSYTHNGSENFTDSFTYRVTDNDGQSSVAMVNINIDSVNTSPVASDINISVTEDSVYTGVLPAASDGDGDGVTYRLENEPAHGSVTVHEDGRFSYAPDADFYGADSFVYSVRDGNGGANSYLVEIDVVPVNDAPSIISQSDSESVLLSLQENSSVVTTVNANDPDNDTLSFSIVGGSDLGLFSIDNLSGELVFNAAPDRENPLDSNQDNRYQVEILVADGNGGADRQIFTVEVRDVDEFDVGLLMDIEDAPDVIPLSGSIEDEVGITVWAEDPDSGNNRISYSLDGDAGGLFAINPSTGVITLVSDLESQDGSQFEITVRATSEDGSFSLQTFNIALIRAVEGPADPEEPFLDEVIFDLGPEQPIAPDVPAATLSEQDREQVPILTAVEAMDEIRQADESLLQTAGEDPVSSFAEPERHTFKQLSSSLFGTDNRNANGFDFVEARLTPTPVSPDELPQFNTQSSELIEVPETIWYLLDTMGQEMSDHRDEQSSSDGIVLQSAALGTLTLSAGYVAWLLRAGVLSASLLSSVPLWRQVDPLPVLSAYAKRREKARDDRAEDDPEEKRLAKLFDRRSRHGRGNNSRKDA